MAKLGALLLKGFRHAASRASRDQHSKGPPRAKPAFKSPTSSTRTSAKVWLEARDLREAKKIPLVQKAKPPAVMNAESLRQNASPAYLESGDLLRPSDRLRKSIESFLLDQRSEHTKRAYGKDLNRFVKFLILRKGNLGIEAITRAFIVAYKDFLLSEKLEHTTVDRHLATLRSFFRWLVEDGIIDKNPAENVRFLNPKRESPTIGFSDEEVVKLLKMPDLHTKTGSMHYAVLMILFFCGLRRSELCELRTSNIGIERGHRFLRLRGKGNAERIVILTDPVWNAVHHYLKMSRKEVQKDQPLFSPLRNNRTSVANKPLDSSMIFYIVTKYAKQSGITSKVSPHSCRATAISNARDHQVPDRAIQEFAGWSTTTMITRYDKRKSALDESAVHKIDYGKMDRVLPPVAPDSIKKVGNS